MFRQAFAALVAMVALSMTAVAKDPVPQVRTQAPGYYRMILGDFEITTVSDGTLPLDVSGIMTNTTPEEVGIRMDPGDVSTHRLSSPRDGSGTRTTFAHESIRPTRLGSQRALMSAHDEARGPPVIPAPRPSLAWPSPGRDSGRTT